jgi:hypothetical protein
LLWRKEAFIRLLSALSSRQGWSNCEDGGNTLRTVVLNLTLFSFMQDFTMHRLWDLVPVLPQSLSKEETYRYKAAVV